MKRLFTFLLGIFTIACSYSQESDLQNAMNFFSSLEGEWEGMPEDTSFISVLQYQKGDNKYMVRVNNILRSNKHQVFAHYEGVYFFNPRTSRIEFTTVNQSDIHTGYCQRTTDTLYHFATIRSKTGNIHSYSSAIIKSDENTLAYYAVYGKDENIPELIFENPLIYRRRKDTK